MEATDEKLINDILQEVTMEYDDQGNIKESTAGREYHYQADWTVGTRMFHVRFDDWGEFMLGVKNMEKLLPSTKDFPNDEGPVAKKATEHHAPDCPVHGSPMKWNPPGVSKRTGKPYAGFYSCGQRNADGSYCSAKPTV